MEQVTVTEIFSQLDADLEKLQQSPPPLDNMDNNAGSTTIEDETRWEELPRLRKIVTEQQARLEASERGLAAREKELKAEQDRNWEIEEELVVARRKFQEKDGELGRVQNQLRKKDAEYQRGKLALDQQTKITKKMERELDNIKKQNDDLRKDKKTSAASMKVKIDCSKTLVAQNEEKWEEKLQFSDGLYQNSLAENADLKQEIMLKKERLAKAEDDLQKWKSEYATLQKRAQSAEMKAKYAEMKVVTDQEKWRKEFNSVNDQLKMEADKTANLNREKKKLEETLDKTRDALKESATSKVVLQATVNVLTTDNEDVRKDREKIRKDLNEKEAKFVTLEKVSKERSKEVAILTSQLDQQKLDFGRRLNDLETQLTRKNQLLATVASKMMEESSNGTETMMMLTSSTTQEGQVPSMLGRTTTPAPNEEVMVGNSGLTMRFGHSNDATLESRISDSSTFQPKTSFTPIASSGKRKVLSSTVVASATTPAQSFLNDHDYHRGLPTNNRPTQPDSSKRPRTDHHPQERVSVLTPVKTSEMPTEGQGSSSSFSSHGDFMPTPHSRKP